MPERPFKKSVLSNISEYFSEADALQYERFTDSNPYLQGATIDRILADVFYFSCRNYEDEFGGPARAGVADPYKREREAAYKNRFSQLNYGDLKGIFDCLFDLLDALLDSPVGFYHGVDEKNQDEMKEYPTLNDVIYICVNYAIDKMPDNTRLDIDHLMYRFPKPIFNDLMKNKRFMDQANLAARRILEEISS